MILLVRLLPLLVGLFEVAAFWEQSRASSSYPWIVLVGWAAVPLAALIIGWKRVSWQEVVNKMAPTFVTLACLGFGLLLVEGTWQFWLLASLAGLIAFISLELLFLLAYDPAAYPVQGLSRVNVGYVPIAVWYAASTSSGLLMFLHIDIIWHIALMSVLGAILFRTTGHPDATREQDRLWTFLGVLVGFEVGALGVFLPLGMQAQGLIAAVMFAAALRARRYLYQPVPGKRLAYAEVASAVVVFLLALVTSKWI